jgi:hypothetical protein
MDDLLNSEQIATLLTTVEEATRSTEEGVKYFVEPATGSLRRATSRRHHVVFGRRGSGKSSLLRKAAADLTVDRRPIAFVDLEPFKGHAYPDLLLSVLIKSFKEFKGWLETAAINPANKVSFWGRLFGRAPKVGAYSKKECLAIVARLEKQINELETQLHLIDEADIKSTSADKASLIVKSEISTGLKTKPLQAGAKGAVSGALSVAHSQEENYRRSKVEFLKRHILDYQKIFDDMALVSNGDAFLFLDDLYHIRKTDQAQVLDFFHSIAKGHHLWLKVGTIRHRTVWYSHGNPPIGVKLGDDAEEIDLDLTLEKYALTKSFLLKVIANLTAPVALKVGEIFTPGALDRLVLASGGVARDFLSIFRRSVDAARDRDGETINAEDINLAAGEYDSSKREEFKRDTYTEEEISLEKVFREITDFCLQEINSNCFLIDKDANGAKADLIHELVDLKLLHLIRTRVTVKSRPGEIFEAYMLDLSQYAGARKKRGLDIVEFWKPDSKDKLRKSSWIFLGMGSKG